MFYLFSILIVCLFFLLPPDVHAYIDPNAGGHFFQTVAPLVVGLIGFAVIILPAIFYLLTLQKALSRCAAENRTMTPGTVWLQLIPLFNLFWHFIIVLNVARSLKKELESRGVQTNVMPGQNLGLAMCILSVLSIIPYIGILFGLACFVCWIVYWVKISGYSNQIA